ncbi:hypothetical protein DPMN_150406 [Dreissena polymorpha]|uniref:Uncharacterized protein n=1 Tax=Dreissena polymorpha TaxID=45954 RepID=A0A9D4FFC4_DREPO|nr:hypothetical protein DPMN_150406 [Dreissena polymorpha]
MTDSHYVNAWERRLKMTNPRPLVIQGVVGRTREFLKTTVIATPEQTVMTDGHYANAWEQRLTATNPRLLVSRGVVC